MTTTALTHIPQAGVLVPVPAVAGDLVEPMFPPVKIYLGKQSPAGRVSLTGSLRFVAQTIWGQPPRPRGCPRRGAPTLQTDILPPAFWENCNYEYLENVKRRLIDTGKKPATINQALSAIRGVLRVCARMGYISRDTLEGCLAVDNINASNDVLAGREVVCSEVEKIFRVCNDNTPGGIRDIAIVALMWGAGLRRHEVAGLVRFDVDEQAGRVVVRGKGSKTREVYIAGGALGAMVAWCAIRGTNPGPLFVAIQKNGVMLHEHITPQAVYKIVKTRREQAGVSVFSPHDLRRSLTGNLLQAGADINTVAGILGHSDINTTARYDRRNSIEKKRVAGLVNTPYFPGVSRVDVPSSTAPQALWQPTARSR